MPTTYIMKKYHLNIILYLELIQALDTNRPVASLAEEGL